MKILPYLKNLEELKNCRSLAIGLYKRFLEENSVLDCYVLKCNVLSAIDQ